MPVHCRCSISFTAMANLHISFCYNLPISWVMNATRLLGRPFILLALLAIGVMLIIHVGRSLTQPDRGAEAVSPAAKPEVNEAPMVVPAIKPETPALKKAVPSPGLHIQTIDTSRGRFLATAPILFNSGLSTLRETSIPILNGVADFLDKKPNVRLEIIGHTDNLGPESVNVQVSTERAQVVRAYLISRGIDPSRLQSKGMGSRDPVESNDTQLGRQANRRIEFLIVKESRSAQAKE
jgi:outer membrane protein OmpA-like peptidoglycan-associated protein